MHCTSLHWAAMHCHRTTPGSDALHFTAAGSDALLRTAAPHHPPPEGQAAAPNRARSGEAGAGATAGVGRVCPRDGRVPGRASTATGRRSAGGTAQTRRPQPSSTRSAYRGGRENRREMMRLRRASAAAGSAAGTAQTPQLAAEQGRGLSRGDPNQQSGTGFELGRAVNRGNRPNRQRQRLPVRAEPRGGGSGMAARPNLPRGPPAAPARHRLEFGRH